MYRRNDDRVDAAVTVGGRLFQALVPAAEKDRSPSVDLRVTSTTNADELEDLRRCRDSNCATRNTSIHHYVYKWLEVIVVGFDWPRQTLLHKAILVFHHKDLELDPICFWPQMDLPRWFLNGTCSNVTICTDSGLINQADYQQTWLTLVCLYTINPKHGLLFIVGSLCCCSRSWVEQISSIDAWHRRMARPATIFSHQNACLLGGRMGATSRSHGCMSESDHAALHDAFDRRSWRRGILSSLSKTRQTCQLCLRLRQARLAGASMFSTRPVPPSARPFVGT